MRLKLDENLPRRLAEQLAGAGHSVDTVGDEDLVGADDETVLATCTVAERALVTLDRGLGEQALRTPAHSGVVVVRPPTQSVSDVIATLNPFLDRRDLPEMTDTVVVVHRSRIRIRRR